MDAERSQDFNDPNELFVNTPEGASGPSGYTEMSVLHWVNDKIAALFRRIRAHRSR
jgi:hypothetical protein